MTTTALELDFGKAAIATPTGHVFPNGLTARQFAETLNNCGDGKLYRAAVIGSFNMIECYSYEKGYLGCV